MIVIKTKRFEDYILDQINLHYISFINQIIPYYKEIPEEQFNNILSNITEKDFYYIDKSITDKIVLINTKKNNRKKFSIKNLIENCRIEIINIFDYPEIAKDNIINAEFNLSDQEILDELLKTSNKLTRSLLVLKVLRKFNKI